MLVQTLVPAETVPVAKIASVIQAAALLPCILPIAFMFVIRTAKPPQYLRLPRSAGK